MKLKEIKRERTCRTGTVPYIRFSKTGAVNINGVTALLLGLKPGDSIGMFQDEDEPKDWYIKKGGEFTLRSASSGRGLIFNSSSAYRAVCGSLGILGGYNIRVAMKEVSGGYFPLITSETINKHEIK